MKVNRFNGTSDKLKTGGGIMRPSQLLKLFIILPVVLMMAVPAMATSEEDAALKSANIDSDPELNKDPREANSTSKSGSSVPTSTAPVEVTKQLSMYDKMTCNQEGKTPTAYKKPEEVISIIRQFEGQSEGCRPPDYENFRRAVQAYNGDYNSCVQRSFDADMMCLENCSKDVKNMVAGAGMIMTTFKQTGIVDACGKMNKLMNVVQGGLTAFSANCGIRKALCDKSCTTTEKSIKSMQPMLDKMSKVTADALVGPTCGQGGTTGIRVPAYLAMIKMVNQLKPVFKEELNKETPLTIAQKTASCGGYSLTLMSAGTAILSAVVSAKKATNCDNETNGVGKVDTRAMCEKPENKDQPTCICLANPRLPGCALATSASTTGEGGGFNASPTAAAASSGKSTLDTSSGGLDPVAAASASKNGETGGLPGSPSGGGFSAGGGLGGAGDNKANPETVKKMNTGIFGGEGGGGGGGYGGSGADRAIDPAVAEKVRAEREIASLRAQVSSQGGKSNWEKVQERYTQEKPKLIGR